MPWAPAGVPGLLASFDGWTIAEDAPGIADGDPMGTWYGATDTAGLVAEASPVVAGPGVAYDASDARRPGVKFASGDTRMYLPWSIFDTLAAATGAEVFAVVRSGSPKASRHGFWYLWNSDYSTNFPWDNQIYDAAFNASRNLNFAPPGAIDDGPHILNEDHRTGAPAERVIRWDGAVVASGAASAASFTALSGVRPWIGASKNYNIATEQWSGTFYAFLAYDHALSTAERDSVHQQLADRWGISVQLSDGSTYVGNPDPPATATLDLTVSIEDDPAGPIVTIADAPADAVEMLYEIRDGFYSRTLFSSGWIPAASPIVLAAGTFAPGWRNLFRAKYRDAGATETIFSDDTEFFPAWAWPDPGPLPPRNTQAEFETPGVAFEGTSASKRPDALSWSYLVAHTIGPRDVSDTSEGLAVRPWRIRYDPATGDVFIRRANDAGDAWEAETLLFTTAEPIEEIDLAFNQNGQPNACAQVAGAGGPEVWMYWPNPAAGGALVFEKVADGRNPRIVLDDPIAFAESDVLVFYFSDAADHLCYRVQRELFATENLHPLTHVANYFLEDVAISQNNRLQIIGSVRDPVAGTYALAVTESAPYAFPVPAAVDTDQTMQSAELIDTLLIEGPYLAELDTDQAITAAGLVDLVQSAASPGDGAELDTDQELISAAVVDLVLVPDRVVAGGVGTAQQLSTATVTTFVIAPTTLVAGGVDATQTLLSIALVPA